MGDVWTHGVWTVKAGREDEFVAAWRKLAREALDEFETPGPPHLLRDREQPNVFRSFGPWSSLEDVERFRASLAPHMSAMEDLLESFEPYTLDEVAVDE